MKKLLLSILLFVFATSIISCNDNGVNPEKIFAKIGLNGNKIPRSFKTHFNEIRTHISKGTLTIVTKENKVKEGVTATEYVENNYPNMFEEDIKEIKKLASDEETKPIIDAGLKMFLYADEIYKNDFVRIAKMIDDKKTNEEIDVAIEELDATKGLELDKKYEAVMRLLLPYADKNKVEYKIMDTKF